MLASRAIGGAAGVAAATITGWSKTICVITMMTAVPAAHIPAPITFLVFALNYVGAASNASTDALAAAVIAQLVGAASGFFPWIVGSWYQTGGSYPLFLNARMSMGHNAYESDSER